MESQATITLGGISLPLGATAADMVDRVTTQVTLSPLRFTLDYRQVRFTCTCEERDDKTVAVKLVARLGIVPYTAESAQARAAVMTIAESARHALGGVSVAEGYVIAQFQTTLAGPITATSVISAVAVMLIRLNPYLALLGDIIELPLAQQTRKNAIRPQWRNKG